MEQRHEPDADRRGLDRRVQAVDDEAADECRRVARGDRPLGGELEASLVAVERIRVVPDTGELDCPRGSALTGAEDLDHSASERITLTGDQEPAAAGVDAVRRRLPNQERGRRGWRGQGQHAPGQRHAGRAGKRDELVSGGFPARVGSEPLRKCVAGRRTRAQGHDQRGPIPRR